MEENKKPDNPQAFPMDYRHEGYRMETGITARDYFAAKAMQAFLSQPNIGNVLSEVSKTMSEADEVIAITAYRMADAMLTERQKQS